MLGLFAASCASAGALTEQTVWERFRQSALDARCDPYFTRPFRGTADVDIAVLGRARDVEVHEASALSQSGSYTFHIEQVLYGRVHSRELVLNFAWQEDGLGHRYGTSAPLGRAIVYLRRHPDTHFEVIKEFLC